MCGSVKIMMTLISHNISLLPVEINPEKSVQTEEESDTAVPVSVPIAVVLLILAVILLLILLIRRQHRTRTVNTQNNMFQCCCFFLLSFTK